MKISKSFDNFKISNAITKILMMQKCLSFVLLYDTQQKTITIHCEIYINTPSPQTLPARPPLPPSPGAGAQPAPSPSSRRQPPPRSSCCQPPSTLISPPPPLPPSLQIRRVGAAVGPSSLSRSGARAGGGTFSSRRRRRCWWSAGGCRIWPSPTLRPPPHGARRPSSPATTHPAVLVDPRRDPVALVDLAVLVDPQRIGLWWGEVRPPRALSSDSGYTLPSFPGGMLTW
jgi:hypothetical protein